MLPLSELLVVFEDFLKAMGDVVWGWPMIILLLGTHIYLTIRLRFIQRFIFKGIKISFSRVNEGTGDISQFGALTTALAATIGTGNIVGVSTAIAAGGPGAVFWMWLSGFFGIATKYSEALLAIHYRVTLPNGNMAGGPMYSLERGLNARWLGLIFAAFTAITAFGIGNMVQANSISQMLKQTINLPPFISGLILAFITGIVILGGIRSIAKICEVLVPFMAIFYILGCLILIIMHIETIPATIVLIFKSAFTGSAAWGGVIGITMREAIRMGVSRGLFSNESGLGSAPIVAAAAQTQNPVRQALVSSTGTFWDTVVICALTGMVIVNSGDWQSGIAGAELTYSAFSNLPWFGPIILSVGLLTFVFSTILGWSYYGEKAVEYIIGTSYIIPYRILWVLAVLVGAVLSLPIVWSLADITNALMAIPNLISLLLLTGVIVSNTHRYLWDFQAKI